MKLALSRREMMVGIAGGSFALLAACGRPVAAAHRQSVSDLRGREVAVPIPSSKLSVDDGRYLLALCLIHDDPVSVLSAWSGDVNRLSPEIYEGLLGKFPQLADLPTVPSSAQDFSVEAVLATQPEVAIVSLGAGPSDTQVSQLQAAGVGVVFIDFFTRPFDNQARSLSLLGKIVGREEQAEAYNSFRAERLERIRDRVSGLSLAARPTVFLEAHAGNSPDCCNSPGKGNVGDYIEFVGGRNIGADVIGQSFGKLNLEYVIDRDPDIYIATGGPHLEKAGGFVVGPQFSEAAARASLQRVASRRGISSLSAVRNGRVYGLSHLLINSPIDIVATEALASWIHPELFADIDPRATLDEINKRFLAVPYPENYWVSLIPA